jgi:hypothetical protein
MNEVFVQRIRTEIEEIEKAGLYKTETDHHLAARPGNNREREVGAELLRQQLSRFIVTSQNH